MHRFKIVDNCVLISDTHFGRKFKEGIPLERRGEYEESIYKAFEVAIRLNMPNVVHLGDLFDTYDVGVDTLYRVYKIIREAAVAAPERNLYFIAGNHDLNKNSEKKSSFEILSRMLDGFPNVMFIYTFPFYRGDVLMVPYGNEGKINNLNCKYVFGHFDKPLPEVLEKNFEGDIYSGHYHLPEVYGKCTYIGSLKPLAFGEESDTEDMVTVSLDEWNNGDFDGKRVRILLKEGESLPDNDKNALQLVAKKIDSEASLDDVTVDVSGFDLQDLFFDCIDEGAEELWLEYCSLKARTE